MSTSSNALGAPRVIPWLFAAGMLAACAHGSTPVLGSVDDGSSLRAALAHPTQRDRPLLERHLAELDASLSRASPTPSRVASLLSRVAVVRALAGLADERRGAFEAAIVAADPTQSPMAVLRAGADEAAAVRADLSLRLDASLGDLIALAPADPAVGEWLGERLRFASDGGRDDVLALAEQLLRDHPTASARGLAIDLLPAAIVRSRPPGGLEGQATVAHLRALGLQDDELLDALDSVVGAARGASREAEALAVALAARSVGADSPSACRAEARVVALLVRRDGPRATASMLEAALDRYADLRSVARGSVAERTCRGALVGTSLEAATRLYRDALGLPETVQLAERVPPAVRPFDRERMRTVESLLTRIVAAFPDLRPDDTLEPELPHLDALALDAARRVVEDAILATDPTPPPAPRRHTARRGHRSHRRGHRHGARPPHRAHR